MKKTVLLLSLFITFRGAYADNEDLKRDIQLLQDRIEKLEAKKLDSTNFMDGIALKGRIIFHMAESSNNSSLEGIFYHPSDSAGKFNTELDYLRFDISKEINNKSLFYIKLKSANSDVYLTEAFLRYKFSTNFNIDLGLLSALLSLENENSDFGDQLSLSSVYDAAGNLFKSKGMGIRFTNKYSNFGFSYGIYGNHYNESTSDLSKLLLNFKSYYNPFLDGNNLIHLGLTYYADFSNYTEDRVPNGVDNYFYTIKDFNNVSLEFAFNYNSLNLRSEITTGIGKPSAVGYDENFTFHNYYLQASYLLTGETLSYSGGSFGTVDKVLKPVNSGGYGAFELSFKYSKTDLQDKKKAIIFDYGVYDKYSFAFNWIPIENIKFVMEYTKINEKFIDNYFTSKLNNGTKNSYEVFSVKGKIFF